ncbi:glycoside hydrolase family 43 protein [Flavilitoribacter nigricans]|uniref:Beta-xylosidase n=1 Tax=Flavilitoribacter nigricans (strain ATCC 23147 / DSM 23189 / NBRC 102662 / NCIMB 1420 / SS-2) TaxID=1122177 RepID=A0A2D0N2E9_FLAN2|nr:glycoside hydrolase family 43 protein [Flavilitoribacter nigricans]PHN02701.1 beta-xylosidase [Flavilitoribacter nigricans DSM 23189 = NBRC 102662]
MKKYHCTALLLLLICGSCTTKREIFFADPTIFEEDGTYYLTGTKNREPLGFAVLQSRDLRYWKSPSADTLHMILRRGDHTYGSQGFWAPQILRQNGQYYLTHTANEQTVLTQSDALLGPYRQQDVRPIDDSEKNIDSYLFRDEDGTFYLYHVRFDRGNYLWVAEFDLTTGRIKPETLRKCFAQTEPWEATPNFPSDPILEGPTVLLMRGKYYLFYSANHFRNIDYAVGYATADSPYGPWEKHPGSPIIYRSIVGENGSGHGDVFTGPDEQLYYVYHVHNSAEQVSPRRTRIIPLQLEWNEQKGIYDISVELDGRIVPLEVIRK